MGDRGNICMEMEDGKTVYLYSHWTGTDLPTVLANALKRGINRWDDEPYLCRIIFSEMVQGREMEETGFGIATYECDKNHDTIFVNCDKQEVKQGNKRWTFSEYASK